MYKSLKDFVDFLESKGELIRIKEFVDPVLEIAEITDRISKQPGGGKAILFENTGTDYPVLTNMMGSEKRMAAALGVESIDEIPQIMNDLMKDLLQPRSSLLDKIKLLPQLKEASEWFPKKTQRSRPLSGGYSIQTRPEPFTYLAMLAFRWWKVCNLTSSPYKRSENWYPKCWNVQNASFYREYYGNALASSQDWCSSFCRM